MSRSRFSLVALLLAMAAVMAMLVSAAPASADDGDATLTMAAPQGDTFTAYRMFAGIADENRYAGGGSFDSETADPAIWTGIVGEGVDAKNVDQVIAWLSDAAKSDPSGTAMKVGEAFDSSAEGKAFSAGEAVSLPAGYYVVTGSAKPIPTMMALKPGQSYDVSVKPSVPTLVKKIVADDGTLVDDASAGFAAPVPFRLTGTVSADYDERDSYAYAFKDDMNPSMELVDGSVKVSVEGEDGADAPRDVTAEADVSYSDGMLSVSFADLKKVVEAYSPDLRIVLDYEANLVPGKATFGAASPNVNRGWLEYVGHDGSDGKTTEDTASVYSFRLAVLKVASDTAKPLAGAKFKLGDGKGSYLTESGTWANSADAAAEPETDSYGSLVFEGLAPGSYTLIETAAPNGYEKAADSAIEVSVGGIGDGKEKIELSAKAASDGGAVEVKKVDTASGTVTVQVADEPEESSGIADDSEEDDDASVTNTSKNEKKRPTPSPIESIASAVPKLGDAAMPVAIALGLAAIVAGVALASRRRGKGGDGE